MNQKLAEGADLIKKGAKYLELGGEPQTGETFDKMVVRRMGEEFYREVFSPAIKEAHAQSCQVGSRQAIGFERASYSAS